ncbi:MAG: hypothetical protein RL685_4028 [Pseudomonadota bacterium]|jgi:hypothetical protein
MTLSSALSRLDLDAGELEALRALLQGAAASLKEGQSSDAAEARTARTVSSCLSSLSPHAMQVQERAYVWRGTLPMLDASLLRAHQEEAARHREQSQFTTRHLLFEGAPLADRLANSAELRAFVEQQAAIELPRDERSRSFYHYYLDPAHRVEPHIDVDDFALSLLVMLDHPHAADVNSKLYLYPPGQDPLEFDLAPGEGVLFYSGSVIHARSAPSADETVTTLSMGFRLQTQQEVHS